MNVRLQMITGGEVPTFLIDTRIARRRAKDM
jgi:hypothetical protein